MQSSIPLTRILLVAGLLLASVRSVQAADITWTGVTGGGDGTSWHDVNNWDLLRVPTNDDVVIIPDVAGTTEVHYSAAAGTTSIDSMTCDEPFRLSGGTLEIDSLEIDSASFANSTYTQTGGTLEGSGDLTVTGSLTWSGGTMAGAGKTIANGDMLLNISGQVELRRNLDNAATATWASGSLLIGSAGVFTNTGIFDAQGNNSIGLTGPPGTFDNQGTFRKSAGGGTTNVEVVFDNSDTVDVQDGTLNLSGGGNHTDSIIMGDATLEFSGDFGVGITNDLDLNTTVSVANLVVTHATMNLAGTYEPTGPTISTWVNGSAVANFTGPIPGSVGDLTISNESTANFSPSLPGTLTADTYTQGGGWLEGSGDLTVTGQMIWSNGGMRGAGTTLANGDIQLSGGALQRHLVSAGTTTWTNGSFGINSPGVWSNMPGAHFDAQSSGPSNATLGGSGGRFDNRGTFQKSTTGTTKVEVPFNNTGTVDVQDGLLQMTRGGTHTDAIITGTGTLEFGGNFGVGITYELVGATLVRVANLVVTHAIMNLAGTYEPTGPTISTWVNGSAVANFTGPIPGSVGDLTISNESTANFSPPGGTLTASTYTQTGGWLEGSGDLNVTGQLIWLNGGMRGAGTTLANGDIQLSGGALQRHLESAGTTTWINGSFGINSPGVWSNMPGAVFDAQASGLSNATMGGSGGRFDNRGTFQKSTDETTKVQVRFDNTGTVDVQDGLLQMTGRGTHTDAIITGNGALEFGGNFGGGITYGLDADTTVRVANLVVTHAIMNLAGTYEPTGPTISTKVNGSAVANFTGPIPGSVGDLTINNESTANFSPPGGTLTASTYTQTVHSTLTGSGDLTITGQVSWNQGTMAGTGKTLATGDIQLWGGALQRNLKSAGTTTWHSGSITIDSPAVWTNTGVFDAQASGSANATMGGSGGTFDNQGTFQKSTPGTTKVEVPFNNTNTGTVDVQTNGLLHFKVSAPYTQTGGVTSLNGGDIRTDHLTGLNLLGGYLLGDGLITGNVTNAGGAVAVSAGFTPPGTMSIDGNYWQGATGLLRVRVLATGVDLISISGSAALDGALLINTGGFVPSLGTSYVPLTYAPRMGCFRRIAGLTIDATKAFEPTFNPTELILSVTDTPRNLDCNGNLVLDECDLSSGASDDCQPNGIPDECDIADGTSQDCPMDGVPDGKPDECQDGKCCLPDSVCLDRDRSFCLTAGGDWRGPCRTCPFQNGVEFYEGDGSIFVHRIGPPVDCGGLSSRAASGGCTPGGTLIDTWESQADAAMCHQFGVPGSPAIPADFFDTGSSPFTGPVCLQGLPLGPTPWGEFGTADTLIARTEDPFEHCDLPSAAEVTVSIELVALSLESVAPITVMVNGQPEDWDVFVDLSTVAPPLGMLTATKSHCNGGTYTSVLNVLPRFTFTKVSDPGQVRVLDTGVEGIEPVVLPQNTPAPWVSDVDPELGLSGDVCSYFHAGIEEPVPPASCDCNANLLNDACELDCNANAVPDDCDAPGDFEADGDWDLADFLDFSACFTGACPAPPCDPALYTDECCLIADFEPDGDVDYDDLAQFVSGLTGPQ